MSDYTAKRLVEQAQRIATLEQQLAELREAVQNISDITMGGTSVDRRAEGPIKEAVALLRQEEK